VSEEFVKDGSSAARLAREAELTSSLNHPNIVTVHDVGELDARPFIVMEFIDGHSLFQAIETGPMKPARAVDIACQIADGLAAAHGAGVVHRDLKPRNVMIADESRVKIVDFGLGKVPAPLVSGDAETVLQPSLTEKHVVMGTAGYMSPEQVLGQTVDFRSDQFALGSILYEMLTGRPAFKRDTSVLTMAAVAEGEPPLLADLAPDTPSELATIVERCLSKHPADRYASTRDLARDLHDAKRTITGARSVSTVRRPLPRRRRRWAAAAVAAVVIGAAGTYAFLIRSNPIRDAQVLLDRYYKAENVDRAIALLEPAVAARPSDPVRQTLLAEAYWRRYEITRDKTLIDRAANAASASLKLNQNYAPTHVVLAMFNNGQSRFDGAYGEALLATKLDARSSGAWRELGRAYWGQRKPDEAGQAYLKAVEVGPNDWTAHNNLGGFYFNTGRIDEATASFERVLELAADNVKAYNNLGSMHLRQERFDRASEMYERSLSIERNPTALSNLAGAYYAQGLFADAARTFEAAVAMPGPTYQLWANLGAACYFAPGLRDRARVAYENAIKLGEERRDVTPKEPGVLAALADAHAVLALLSDEAGAATHAAFARSLLANIEQLKPSVPDDLFTVASTYEELGDRAQALEWLVKATKAGYPINRVRRSPWLKALRDDPAYIKQFPQR
jgi:serine/threonine protein kinase/Flp pilus assembly protein TadD